MLYMIYFLLVVIATVAVFLLFKMAKLKTNISGTILDLQLKLERLSRRLDLQENLTSKNYADIAQLNIEVSGLLESKTKTTKRKTTVKKQDTPDIDLSETTEMVSEEEEEVPKDTVKKTRSRKTK